MIARNLDDFEASQTDSLPAQVGIAGVCLPSLDCPEEHDASVVGPRDIAVGGLAVGGVDDPKRRRQRVPQGLVAFLELLPYPRESGPSLFEEDTESRLRLESPQGRQVQPEALPDEAEVLPEGVRARPRRAEAGSCRYR